MSVPAFPTTEAELDDLLSAPSVEVGQALAALGGDIVFLGAGGKIGPTMARMARRSLDAVGSTAQVHAVSRSSDPAMAEQLERDGLIVHRADLADPAVYADLPDAAAVFYLAAMKFGSTGAEGQTWWSNASIPTLVASRYRGVPTLVYSTGNVYPLSSVGAGGSLETDPLGPIGEYAQSCLARERIFSQAAQMWGTPITIFRLNYACELRYGVIADIATKIAAGDPVDVTMPAVNVCWQGDISAWALRSIEHASTAPFVLNATGRRPHTEGLGLETVGARTDERGAVVIDERFATTADGVWAIGDVTDRRNLTPVAIAEGRAWAESTFGGTPRTLDFGHIATAVFLLPPLGTIGPSEADALAAGHAVKVYEADFRPMKQTFIGGAERSYMKLLVDADTDRVLAVHMLGADAPEIVQSLAVAITCGATKAQFDATVAVHPTSAEEFVLMREPARTVRS